MGAGIWAVLVDPFARLRFCNDMPCGFPFITINGMTDLSDTGNKPEFDLNTGNIRNLTNGKTA